MIAADTLAPDFTLPRDGGGNVTLSQYKGMNVVLFFYPKDNTPGCTTEAIDFTAHLPDFAGLNTVVLGISKDSVKKHENFCAKHNLKVPLLSDAGDSVCETYGVWKEKKMYGKTFWGIERTTVLIDKDGTIKHVWNKVKVPGHVAEVLEETKKL